MKNQLFYGDNLENLQKFVENESVDLCYIDPPFNSKRNYNQIYNNVGTEDKAQAQAFIDTWTWNIMANEAFLEITNNKNGFYTPQTVILIEGLQKLLGNSPLMAYLVSMAQRISEIYRVLKPTGSFYLHCDPTASHYLKLILDSVFCSRGGVFQNEIAWCYGSGGASKEHFSKKHDVVLFYTKNKIHTFNVNEVREKYSSPHKSMTPKVIGNKSYVKMNPLGRIPFDWWQIPILTNSAKERLGYPTQKPEALLEKIIKVSSNEGDVVLDAYCGCGTTVAVAERLKRSWIGIDITYQSISLIIKRLEDSFGEDFTKDIVDKESKQIIKPANLKLSGVPQDFAAAVALANKEDDRVRKEFEKWFVLSFSDNRAMINEKKGGDDGIDGLAFILDFDEKNQQDLKKIIFSVKSGKTLSTNVIRDLVGTMEREKAVIGYLLTLYPMPNLVKDSGRYGIYQSKMFGHSYPKIEVISVDDFFAGKRLALPTNNSIEVLKKAKIKTKNITGKLDL
ncbi:MAG: site-specific DNA-methyltransferase [Bacteroidetes bacterium]|nr:MAG: site-specific DNA-methyltransferase [Bacteroidota bacterium]